jgi:hypothetical protein
LPVITLWFRAAATLWFSGVGPPMLWFSGVAPPGRPAEDVEWPLGSEGGPAEETPPPSCSSSSNSRPARDWPMPIAASVPSLFFFFPLCSDCRET